MKYFIKTYGCQMNVADSEKLAAALEDQGYSSAKTIKNTDLVVINSCSVRQSAEDRVVGLVYNLSKLKPRPKVWLTGCMLYHDKGYLRRKLRFIDKLVSLEKLIKTVKSAKRSKGEHAWVRIMVGCDNFCTYCVVPYARGQEKSRPILEVICEVQSLVKRGYTEITLLGQNVNSYGKSFKGFKKTPFAVLLTKLNSITGLKKIAFMTSNPHDMTEDIIQALALPKIDRYLHLALQSGNDQILKRMNRKYTVEQFLDLVKKIRQVVPKIKLGTDIIVGFPGETKAQFEDTVNVCQQVGFSVGYINKYSPRPGTAAAKLEDNVVWSEKQRRWRVLNKLINKKR